MSGCVGYSSSRHIGRVGVLAVALGIGAAIAAMPAVASADTADTAGPAGAAGTSRTGPKADSARGPSTAGRDTNRRAAAPVASRAADAVSRSRAVAPSTELTAAVSTRVPSGVDGRGVPAAETLIWAAATGTRRGVDRRLSAGTPVGAPTAVALTVDAGPIAAVPIAAGTPQIQPMGGPDQPDGGGVSVTPAPVSNLSVAHATDEILIAWKSGVSDTDRATAMALVQASISSRLGTTTVGDAGDGVYVLKVPGGADAAIAALTNNQAVDFVEPNYRLTNGAIASDSYYNSGALWGMESSDSPAAYGPSGTTNLFGSGAEQAWGLGYTGSRRTVIGIVDTGIQITHPDIAANIWTNPGENPIPDGVDNDGNGYVDDINGWDFYYNDSTVYDGAADSHGTHVAGTIVAVGNNGIGVAGACWSCQVIPAKFLGPDGGYTSDAVRAIDYLVDLKSRYDINLVAINNSWGGGAYSYALHGAILRAAKSDILFVAAAGNGSSNNDGTSWYPSNYSTLQAAGGESAANYEAVIAVASITPTGDLSSFSNYGATTVDLGAPGSGIVSTVPDDSYAFYSGTSMATPHVTGAIALLASYRSMTAAQLRSAILTNTKATTSLAGRTVTGGRLSLEGIFSDSNPAPAPDPTPTPTPVQNVSSGTTPTPTPAPAPGIGTGFPLLTLFTDFINSLISLLSSLFGIFSPAANSAAVTPVTAAVTTQVGAARSAMRSWTA